MLARWELDSDGLWHHDPEFDLIAVESILPGAWAHWQTQTGGFLFLPIGIDANLNQAIATQAERGAA